MILLKQDSASVSLVLTDHEQGAVASEMASDAGAGISTERSPDLVLPNNPGCLLQRQALSDSHRDAATILPVGEASGTVPCQAIPERAFS